MIEIEKTLVSLELFTEEFTCDLSACKGACCVLGDAGAPLDEEECAILDDIRDELRPYLSDSGNKAIDEQGNFLVESDGTFSTPLINGGACAYTVFNEQGIALCGIEQAYRDGAVAWKKPLSCELYPIRIKQLAEHEALNYHRWHICKPACSCGKKLKMPVFRFLKQALTRKYGAEYYQALEAAHTYLKENTSSNT